MVLHVSGEKLIEEGVDDGSHTKAKNLWGLRCSRAWREFNIRILQEAAEISIVFVASLWNALAPRFASRTLHRGSGCFLLLCTGYVQDFGGAWTAHGTRWRSTSQKPSAGRFGAWSSRRRRGLEYDSSGPFTQPALARLHLSVREKRERNPAQGAPQGQVETKRSPKDSSAYLVSPGLMLEELQKALNGRWWTLGANMSTPRTRLKGLHADGSLGGV